LLLRTLAVSVVAGAALLAPAGNAHAIDPGIHFDSGSPAGKEYAIPFVEGRAEGAGTTNQRRAAGTLFGIGITPPGGGGGSGQGGGGSGQGGGGSGQGGGRSGQGGADGSGEAAGGTGTNGSGRGAGAPSARDRAELRSRIADAESPGGTGTWTLGIALAVLLPGLLVGLLLRRRPDHRLA
jgi:hypothetical protein